MISSIIYPPKNAMENMQNSKFQVDSFQVIQIIIMKIIVVVNIIFLPLILHQQNACLVITVLAAFQFWIYKNLGRAFLKANWFVQTSTQKDEWIYEASLKSPDAFQGIFWYSSIAYLILLLVTGLYYVSKKHYSLFCSILIGFICGYMNFFAFSKIIKTRNQGVLDQIAKQVDPHGQHETIQMPLIVVKSVLYQIDEKNQSLQLS